MKKILKKYFPIASKFGALYSFLDYFIKYSKYSSISNYSNKEKLEGRIIADYHVIEKGLTMPKPRLGFGQERVNKLIDSCLSYIKTYDQTNVQLKHAISVLLEYKEFHVNRNHKLPIELLNRIDSISLDSNINSPSFQKEFKSKEIYFSKINSDFQEFSNSRLSVRNFSKISVSEQSLDNAVKLAINAPSSCNRQTTRVHIVRDKKEIEQILSIQGGNRGFGHLVDKLILLTSDLSFWHGVYEKSAPYVDGGIFAMNLLYSLHYNKIAACPLNCNLSPKKDRLIRKIIAIPKSEVFVVMISCGVPQDNFKVPYSKRNNSNSIIKFH